jgi:hypothetical protein
MVIIIFIYFLRHQSLPLEVLVSNGKKRNYFEISACLLTCSGAPSSK